MLNDSLTRAAITTDWKIDTIAGYIQQSAILHVIYIAIKSYAYNMDISPACYIPTVPGTALLIVFNCL